MWHYERNTARARAANRNAAMSLMAKVDTRPIDITVFKRRSSYTHLKVIAKGVLLRRDIFSIGIDRGATDHHEGYVYVSEERAGYIGDLFLCAGFRYRHEANIHLPPTLEAWSEHKSRLKPGRVIGILDADRFEYEDFTSKLSEWSGGARGSVIWHPDNNNLYFGCKPPSNYSSSIWHNCKDPLHNHSDV